MTLTRLFGLAMLASLFTICSARLDAQVVINEIVEDEQDSVSSDVSPDTREFIELYNTTDQPILIEGWTLGQYLLSSGAYEVTDTLPVGATIPANGYYVIGAQGVPNVNYTPVSGELWTQNAVGSIFELRRAGDNQLIDAVGIDTFRGVELANATQEQLDQIKVGQTPGPDAQGGWWGQLESNNTSTPLSLARYQDGRDRDVNGYDFGLMPVTPGTANGADFLPRGEHVIPDVDGMAVGTALGDEYYASFVLPRVVDPTVATGVNPKAIPERSPQGGNAIIAWDETGGGNAIFSRQFVDKFSLSAYIDTSPLATSGTAIQSEATIYGIGTTDPFFATPDAAGLLGFGSSANGSTGIGWYIQRVENKTAGTDTTMLMLIDFNDSGDGVPEDEDWIVIQSIDLSSEASAWHDLGIDYDPDTGNVVATHNGDTYNFTTETDLMGTFYAGYRENLPGVGAGTARPPTFDIALLEPPVFSGDYNGDGVVDAADYTVWRNSVGMMGQGLAADGNGDEIIDGDDYVIWKDDFGSVYDTQLVASAAVPEPATAGLVGLALAGLIAYRRRGA